MEILAITLIIILSATEAYCLWTIKNYLKDRSEERTDNRRAFYRARAYKDLNYKRGLKTARETLWRAIPK